MSPIKIMFAGDFHGNTQHARQTAAKAKILGVDAVFQLGDFGFTWDLPQRLTMLNNIYARFDMPLYWLDGNHENFDVMAELGAHTDAEDMVKLGSHITYVPRGHVWEWDGVRFLAMGGAYSIDKAWREPGKTWWPQELITDADIARAVTNLDHRTVDIMLAHDAPELPPVLNTYMHDPHNPYGDYKCDLTSEGNRIRLRGLMDRAEPKLYLHGHMHHRYNDVLGDTVVSGISCDGEGAMSWVIIDTDQLDEEIAAVRPAMV